MSSKIAYTITDHNITVNYQNQTHIVPRTDALADKLIDVIRARRLEEIPNLVSAAKRIEAFGQGIFQVQGDRIMVNGVEAPRALGNKILQFSNDGLPVEPLIKFAENLQGNPSYRSVNELFQFLEKNNHPLTDTGCFIAYKKVRSDFKDAYTGTIDNSVGQVVQVTRNQVDEDSTRTCSHGLHVANWDYAHNVYYVGADGIMLEVEVNPADVVAVPINYDQAKMRVCKYRVLGVVDQEHSANVTLRVTGEKKATDEVAYNYPCDSNDGSEVDERDEPCSDCGAYAMEEGECLDCGYNEEEEMYECEDCGAIVDDEYTFLCNECENRLEEEEDDRYPWDDEIED